MDLYNLFPNLLAILLVFDSKIGENEICWQKYYWLKLQPKSCHRIFYKTGSITVNCTIHIVKKDIYFVQNNSKEIVTTLADK